MPARGREPAEQRGLAFLLVEMKALRIEFCSENLDGIRRESVGADLAAMADLDVLEEGHQTAPSRRLIRIGEVISHSASPLALRAVHLNLTMPSSGRLFE